MKNQKSISFSIAKSPNLPQTNEVMQMLTLIMDKLEKIDSEIEVLKEVTIFNQVILEELTLEQSYLKSRTSLKIIRNRFSDNNSDPNFKKFRRSLIN